MNPTCNKTVQGPNTNPERNSTSRRLFCNQKCENDFEKMGGKVILSDEGVPEYMYQPCMWVELLAIDVKGRRVLISSESTDDEIKLPKRQISCGVSAPD